MRVLSVVLIVIIAFIYIRYNMVYNDHYEILQASPSALTWELLREKNPIVVLVSNDQSLDGAFKYLYLTKSTSHVQPTHTVHLNKARFSVLRRPMTTENDNKPQTAKVEIINPKYKNDPNYTSVEVLLNTTKALILPQHWLYKANTDLFVESYHGFFSLVTSLLF